MMGSKVFHYALKVYLFVSTLFYIPVPGNLSGEQIIEFGYMSQELFFRYGIVALFGLSCFLKRQREMNVKAIGIFLTYLVIISVFTGFDIRVRRTLLNIFFGCLFFKTVYEYLDTDEIKGVFKWLGALLFLNLALCVMQYFRIDPIFTRNDSSGVVDLAGFMRIKATLGTLACVIAPLLVFVSLWWLPVALALVWVSEASSAILALVASLGS